MSCISCNSNFMKKQTLKVEFIFRLKLNQKSEIRERERGIMRACYPCSLSELVQLAQRQNGLGVVLVIVIVKCQTSQLFQRTLHSERNNERTNECVCVCVFLLSLPFPTQTQIHSISIQ